MACKHATTCPLFPKLKGNLAGWRQAYCNTADNWADCARYQRSLSGKPVPIALLPNGHVVEALDTRQPNKRTTQPSAPKPAPVAAAQPPAGTTETQQAARPQLPIVAFFARLFGSKATA